MRGAGEEGRWRERRERKGKSGGGGGEGGDGDGGGRRVKIRRMLLSNWILMSHQPCIVTSE